MGRIKRIVMAGLLFAAALAAFLCFTSCDTGFLDKVVDLTRTPPPPPNYSGKVVTFAGSGTAGVTEGIGTAAKFNFPEGITSDGSYLYIAERENDVIRRVSLSSANVNLFAGAFDPPPGEGGFVNDPVGGTSARFSYPADILYDGVSTLYVVDNNNHAIRRIDFSAIGASRVDVYYGLGTAGSVDGFLPAASFTYPNGITKSWISGFYISDSGNHTIRHAHLTAGVTTPYGFAGSSNYINGNQTVAKFNVPCGITNDGAYLYVVEEENHAVRMIKVATQEVSTLAGAAPQGAGPVFLGESGSTDGVGTAARFNKPYSIACDAAAGVLYVSDTENHTIRKIVIATREVTTFAGSPGVSGSVDGMGTAARFNKPRGIAIVGDYLYVCDSLNHTIRKIWK